jgi:hypothetical protein
MSLSQELRLVKWRAGVAAGARTATPAAKNHRTLIYNTITFSFIVVTIGVPSAVSAMIAVRIRIAIPAILIIAVVET